MCLAPLVFLHLPLLQIVFEKDFDTNYLVDVMSVLIGVGQQRQDVTNGAKLALLIIELDNREYRFRINLFGILVDALTSFLVARETWNTIIAVTFAKVEDWEWCTTIQSTMHASKLLINPNMT